MTNLEIYTKDYCPFCARAKHLLTTKGVSFTEYDVTHDVEGQQEMTLRSQRRTVPQIFIDGNHLGGNDDLVAANESGELDKLLSGQNAA